MVTMCAARDLDSMSSFGSSSQAQAYYQIVTAETHFSDELDELRALHVRARDTGFNELSIAGVKSTLQCFVTVLLFSLTNLPSAIETAEGFYHDLADEIACKPLCESMQCLR